MEDRTIVNDIRSGSTQSSLACTSCRRKKLKCDRIIPQCHACSKTSRDCVYPTVAQKPGPRPGSHRRATVSSRARSVARRHDRPAHDLVVDDTSAENTYGAHESTDPYARSFSSAATTRPISHSGLSSATASPFAVACAAMGMSEKSCLDMIDLYFANMTSFSLFHQPTFLAKVAGITSSQQTQALLTSMLAFTARFMHPDDSTDARNARSADLVEQARVLNERCLHQYLDETPPLHLLQSSLIVALLVSATGVRGRGWRLVGQCIRFAYELRLHELDPAPAETNAHNGSELQVDAATWAVVEEKRRAWWAAWECDVFSCTVQRLPTAIDWSRNHTNLPSCDEAWFAGHPVRSCWLHLDPNRRWKDMRDCGNTSPQAWFLMLDAYKWEALAVNQRTAALNTFGEQAKDLKDFYDETDYKPPLVRRREMLENCLRCALSAVPTSLQFHGGYLAFEPSKNGAPSHTLCRDFGIYAIDIIVQVAQMLLCRADIRGSQYIYVLGGLVQEKGPSHQSHEQDSLPETPAAQTPSTSTHHASTRRRWQLCLFAADRIANIVRHSSPRHPRNCNPNVSTALWMAAATQITALTLYREEIDVPLAQSNLDLLATAIDDFIAFWNAPVALARSLPALRRHLETLGARGEFPPPQLSSSSSAPVVNVDRHQSRGRQEVSDGYNTRHSHETTFQPPPLNTTTTTTTTTTTANVDPLAMMPVVDDVDLPPELTAFDVLQAMDFGAVYNGIENWENLFLDPTFPPSSRDA